MKARVSVWVLLLLFGCVKPYQSQFIEVVQDHEAVTVETINELEQVVKEESESLSLTEADKVKYLDLLERFDVIRRGSRVIKNYIVSTHVDEAMLQELLRSRWERNFEE